MLKPACYHKMTVGLKWLGSRFRTKNYNINPAKKVALTSHCAAIMANDSGEKIALTLH